MNRRAAFYLVLVFVLGVALGGMSTYLADEWKVFDWHKRSREVRRSSVEWWTQELSLTPEQQTQLRTLLEGTGKQYQQVRLAARQRMREMLTEEQRRKFDELLARMDAERRQREERYRNRSTQKETPTR